MQYGRHHIRINCICPGIIYTGMSRDVHRQKFGKELNRDQGKNLPPSAASACPRTSPESRCSWPATTPHLSPPRRLSWTAALPPPESSRRLKTGFHRLLPLSASQKNLRRRPVLMQGVESEHPSYAATLPFLNTRLSFAPGLIRGYNLWTLVVEKLSQRRYQANAVIMGIGALRRSSRPAGSGARPRRAIRLSLFIAFMLSLGFAAAALAQCSCPASTPASKLTYCYRTYALCTIAKCKAPPDKSPIPSEVECDFTVATGYSVGGPAWLTPIRGASSRAITPSGAISSARDDWRVTCGVGKLLECALYYRRQ